MPGRDGEADYLGERWREKEGEGQPSLGLPYMHVPAGKGKE